MNDQTTNPPKHPVTTGVIPMPPAPTASAVARGGAATVTLRGVTYSEAVAKVKSMRKIVEFTAKDEERVPMTFEADLGRTLSAPWHLLQVVLVEAPPQEKGRLGLGTTLRFISRNDEHGLRCQWVHSFTSMTKNEAGEETGKWLFHATDLRVLLGIIGTPGAAKAHKQLAEVIRTLALNSLRHAEELKKAGDALATTAAQALAALPEDMQPGSGETKPLPLEGTPPAP